MATEPPGFAEFLGAKFALDERSANPAVRDALVCALRDFPALECLDLGAGTGVTVPRMLGWRRAQSWSLTLIDREPALLALARTEALRALAANGHRPVVEEARVRSSDADIELHFCAEALESYEPAMRFDAVIAHAFLDLVALEPTLARVCRWLRPEGLLYAAINYDGETELDPRHADGGFEAELLACYNESMEGPRQGGVSGGGAYCGRRLLAALPRHGFEIVAEGRSDWLVVPQAGRYRDRDATCLAVLLELVRREGAAAGRFDPQRLQRWREERMHLMRTARLALRVRNLDVLARNRREGTSQAQAGSDSGVCSDAVGSILRPLT